jgi:hypothetical protein
LVHYTSKTFFIKLLLFSNQPSNISSGLKGGVLLHAVLQGMTEVKDIGVEFVFSLRVDSFDKGTTCLCYGIEESIYLHADGSDIDMA